MALHGGFSALENNSSNLYKFIIDRFNYILIKIFKQIIYYIKLDHWI